MSTSTISVQTTNQLKNGDVIKITAERFPAAARQACAVRMVSADVPLEQALGTLNASIAGIATMMGAANTALEKAEGDYAGEQADDPPVRKARDDANADLAQRWSDVKTQVVRRFGVDAPREFGLEGELPGTPDALAKQSKNAVKLLRDKPRTHASKLGEFTTTGAADHLEEGQTVLSDALKRVTTEAKELQDSLGVRDEAASEWTNVYQACATLLEGYLRLGGRLDLADRVRPTVRRAIGLELSPEVPVDISTTPATTPSTATPPPTTNPTSPS